MTISPLQSQPLNLSSLRLTDEQFYQLCITNPEHPLELTSEGVLIVMPPVGGDSGNREADLLIDLGIWNRQTQLGKVFSSSTIFKLPLGSQRSPDAAWVELSRWNALSADDRSKFPPLAPDFVIELRSRTDKLSDLQEKMLEYRENGVRLGLLINPQDRIVEIYRLDRAVEVIASGSSIDCDDVLPGFSLDLTKIW
ncbi:Uma2 family endonuclease [Chamaesiphon sp. OTE_8_metabat_110]|uniref:Uma2 family endonuclease n=1 Tax=Chamaesiphon sp. OTE_8_metabat_110 TaxID=2964696 RepID=UPI00286B5056|nr:Uma2 family endonuclease [Chamaesiphon sp. OTE_8_metabat_110]